MRNWKKLTEDDSHRELVLSDTMTLTSIRTQATFSLLMADSIQREHGYVLMLDFKPKDIPEGYRSTCTLIQTSHEEVDEKLPELLDWILTRLRIPTPLALSNKNYEVKGLDQLPANAATALG